MPKIFIAAFTLSTILYTNSTFSQKLKTYQDSINYALGVSMASQLKKANFETNFIVPKIINQAFTQTYQEKEIQINEETANKLVQDFFYKKQQETANNTKEKGERFLKENKKRDEVKTTESGLQYEIITEGSGASPLATDKVKVHYTGTLIDGTVFDSSVERGEPITFALNQVIPGWTEALQMMKIGGKRKIYLPYNLGYGERSAGNLIKPFSTLIFEVELIDIEK